MLTSKGAENPFDILAPFYESHWGKAFLDPSIRLFCHRLEQHLATGEHVVELCCGTGYFSQWLGGQGYRVTGIDSSGAMLRYASKRLQRGNLIHADIRDFHVQGGADAIVCFYNSLNHFLNPDSFREVLAASFRNLSPGGWFLFDFVQKHGYEQFWEADEAFTHADMMCELCYRYDDLQQRARCTISISGFQEQPELFRRLVVTQRPYSSRFVSSALNGAGFKIVAAGPVSDGNPPEGRLGVLAQRPHEVRSTGATVCDSISLEARDSVTGAARGSIAGDGRLSARG